MFLLRRGGGCVERGVIGSGWGRFMSLGDKRKDQENKIEEG
jgi:hypothetical protein